MFEDRCLTYAALDAHANRLANHLRGLGVGPETVVGLCVERSPEMVVGLLGILKAGAAYLPLDPNYPRERLAFMLTDAGAPVLVTQQALLERLPVPAQGSAAQPGATIVRLDADWPLIARQPATVPAVPLDPRNPAYVIYTSGSTGTPKAVVVEHQGIANEFRHGRLYIADLPSTARIRCCRSIRIRSVRSRRISEMPPDGGALVIGPAFSANCASAIALTDRSMRPGSARRCTATLLDLLSGMSAADCRCSVGCCAVRLVRPNCKRHDGRATVEL